VNDASVWVHPPDEPDARRRGWRTGLAVLVILAVAIGVAVLRSDHRPVPGLASAAVVTASSTHRGASARDLVTSGSATAPGAVWQSAAETRGAWVQLSWPTTHQLRRMTVVRNSLDEPGMRSGFLSFGDGSFLQFSLSRSSRVTDIAFSPRPVDRVRLTASTVDPGATSVTLAEILATSEPRPDDVVLDDLADGNAALSATFSQSPQARASDPRALQDGSGTDDPADIGQPWTVDRPKGAWVRLDWARPRELTSLAIVGSGGRAARPSALTVTFDDGSRLQVGEILADPTRPTVVNFMPRVTTSVRISLDGVKGSGAVALGEVRAYQRGALPRRTSPPGPPTSPRTEPCPAPGRRPAPSGLSVQCPLAGSVVAGPTVDLQLAVGAGYSAVTVTLWAADPAVPASRSVRASVDSVGRATAVLDVSGMSSGPFTAKVEATGSGRPIRTIFLPLYRGVDESVAPVSSSAAAQGRNLVYAEEFDGPVSLSRTGIGADYAAAKPTHSGAEDFGDAIFADPALGLGNVQVVDNRYLQIGVRPKPHGYVDPQGWGRTHIGGLLASARQGGSGVSAQYGYFEARMLAPAAAGTWPAFWLLPSDNLVRPQPTVAEIDAVELYGHEPTGACQSTHEYTAGRDGGAARCGRRFTDERTALAWHTYGVSVTPSEIVFYIDGREVTRSPQVEGGGAPMFFLVDLALGGGWPIALQPLQDRSVLYVDYVRVYV
jgi:hypothetical protein